MKKNLKTSIIYSAIVIMAIIAIYLTGRSIVPDLIGSTQLGQSAPAAIPGQSLIGKRAPAFALPDIAGNSRSSSQLYGKPTVLVFWTTWNKPSADQIKILDDYDLNQKAQSQLVNSVTIDSQEDASVAISFLKRGGYTATALLDASGAVTAAYNVKSLPATYFISGDGTVRDVSAGLLSVDGIVEKVDNLLRNNVVQ